jgi:sarcosine oxidase
MAGGKTEGGDEADRYDVVVVGVGAMGSAACHHLARRGLRVLGLERFDIPHQMGSSHGFTRIIRLAYYEHPSYVPLLQRAFELWRELEAASGEKLLHVTGSIDAGPADDWVFAGSLASCREHGLAHEVLDHAQLAARFPGYNLPPGHFALFQPEGGFLAPEASIVAHAIGAAAAGATIKARERVLEWAEEPGGVVVRTDRGTYRTDQLVLAAGAWMGKLWDLPPALALPERQVLGWFQPLRPERFTPATFPVFNLSVEEGRYYGFPVFGVPGFKIGRYHHLEEVVDPDAFEREPNLGDEAALRVATERYFPDAAGPTVGLRACLFTNTPDEHFLIDRHPAHPRVVVASPCSGHGFKFASVIGEVIADLVQRGETRHDTGLFRLDRFAGVLSRES